MCDLWALTAWSAQCAQYLYEPSQLIFNHGPVGDCSALQLCWILREFHVGKGKKDQKRNINPCAFGV